MENTTLISLSFGLFLLLITIKNNAYSAKEPPKHGADHDHHHVSVKKLFVFGDSYADTGNSKKASAVSWKAPYGSTFPGKPAGRFSDGRVLTDYIASFLGVKSPVPYRWRKFVTKSKLKYGMNFAFGGTGVFNTMEKEPNMSTQIDFFQHIIEQKFYTKHDLNSSIALVSVAGNDYAAYIANYKGGNNNMEDLVNVSTSIVNQLVTNLKRLRSLGVQKIAVTALEPLGCLPPFTASTSYQNCSRYWNSVSDSHNKILQQNLQNLNNQNEKDVVVVLDLHSTFMSAFMAEQQNITGNLTLEKNPLKPCCVGISNGHSCASVNGNGSKKYTVCNNPNLSFFWDIIHPSQNGWRLVYTALRSSLYELV